MRKTFWQRWWRRRCADVAARWRRVGARVGKGDGLRVLLGALLLLLSVALGVCWWRAVRHGGAEASYLGWKLWFTLTTTFAVGYGWRMLAPARGARVATGALLLVCFVEPFMLIGQWWPGTAKPAVRFTTPARTTRWLQQFAPAEQRVYVRVNGPDEETASQPRFDALDRTALFGLHNVAGYEPLFMERYSRALGGVDFDALSPRPGYVATPALFEPQSHVLDLLNVGYVVAWPELAPVPELHLSKHDGIDFAAGDLALAVAPGQPVSVRGAGGAGNSLALVTSLANSVACTQGTTVARLRVYTAAGQLIERELQAGRDTAEWAHERVDVRAAMQHTLAPVFDRVPGDAANSFTALRYWTRVPLGAHTTVSRIELENVAPPTSLALWKATVYDSDSKQATPLTNEPDVTTLDPARWQVAWATDGVLVLHNTRALPRAWLVAAAEAVAGEEALHRIRGESTQAFEPRRTALLEVRAAELPQLPGGEVAPESGARIMSYEPNRLRIETSAPTATVLVVSEMFYPGWVATLDGAATRINVADYLLRGVALPAGQHTVEMRYTAPAARTGALISALTLLLLCGLAIYTRCTSR